MANAKAKKKCCAATWNAVGFIILGVIAIGLPMFNVHHTTDIIGVICLLGGLVQFIGLFRDSKNEMVNSILVSSVVLVAIGILLFAHGVIMLSLAVGIWLLIHSIHLLMCAFRCKNTKKPYGNCLFLSIVMFVLSMCVWIGAPISGAIAVSILLGIGLVIVGLCDMCKK